MNIKEFKEWLSNFPEETIVEVIITYQDGYNGTMTDTQEFKGEEYTDYEYITSKKKYLTLGYEK